MQALDRRTRTDAEVHTVDAEEFFATAIRTAVEHNGCAAVSAFEWLGASPLSLEIDELVRTLSAEAGHFLVREGAVPGALVVRLSRELFSDVALLVQSFTGLSVAGSIHPEGGRRGDLERWDAIWMALLEGWPAVDPELRFLGRDGSDLDLSKRFTPDDEPAEIAQFLREAGFVALRGWLSAELMEEIAADIRRALPSYNKGDGRSWWATLNDDTERCVRMQHFLEHSPATAEMLRSERWGQLRAALAGDETLVQGPVEGNCIEALVKPLGVRQGISDIPWHRDCSLGRHPYRCASTTIGVSVTSGGPQQGQLRVVAGSHRVNMPNTWAAKHAYLPVVPLATEPGDLTVHQSCTLHEAQPPLTEERLVMYAGFGLPARDTDRPDGGRRLAELREQVPLLRSQAPSTVPAR